MNSQSSVNFDQPPIFRNINPPPPQCDLKIDTRGGASSGGVGAPGQDGNNRGGGLEGTSNNGLGGKNSLNTSLNKRLKTKRIEDPRKQAALKVKRSLG
jgi:hypothetical protein